MIFRGNWIDRFAQKIEIVGECWVWTSDIDKDGYGRFWCCGRTWRTIRFVVFACGENSIKGKHVHHICANKKCVRLSHLMVVTPLEHTRLDETVPAYTNRLKTHCIHGHEFNDSNTLHYIGSSGTPKRGCRVCRREIKRRFRERRMHAA